MGFAGGDDRIDFVRIAARGMQRFFAQRARPASIRSRPPQRRRPTRYRLDCEACRWACRTRDRFLPRGACANRLQSPSQPKRLKTAGPDCAALPSLVDPSSAWGFCRQPLHEFGGLAGPRKRKKHHPAERAKLPANFRDRCGTCIAVGNNMGQRVGCGRHEGRCFHGRNERDVAI